MKSVDIQQRSIEVNMSSEAIAKRLRQAGELNQLGISLSKTKLCPPLYEKSTERAKEPSCFNVQRSMNAGAGGSDVSAAGEVLSDQTCSSPSPESSQDSLTDPPANASSTKSWLLAREGSLNTPRTVTSKEPGSQNQN